MEGTVPRLWRVGFATRSPWARRPSTAHGSTPACRRIIDGKRQSGYTQSEKVLESIPRLRWRSLRYRPRPWERPNTQAGVDERRLTAPRASVYEQLRAHGISRKAVLAWTLTETQKRRPVAIEIDCNHAEDVAAREGAIREAVLKSVRQAKLEPVLTPTRFLRVPREVYFFGGASELTTCPAA
jgi:hypothetical protein